MRRFIGLVLVAVVMLLHPYVDAGSDSDDALEIGVAAIMSGRNPYMETTQLGNPLTPLPGWLILNIPAMFVGAHVWCLLWLFVCLRGSSDRALAVILLLSIKTLIQGIDYAANACVVLWACALLQAHVSADRPVDPALGSVGFDGVFGRISRDDYGQFLRMGGSLEQPDVCNRGGGDYAVRVLCAGVLLLLPALWVSNAAYHVVLAVPFIVFGIEGERKCAHIYEGALKLLGRGVTMTDDRPGWRFISGCSITQVTMDRTTGMVTAVIGCGAVTMQELLENYEFIGGGVCGVDGG